MNDFITDDEISDYSDFDGCDEEYSPSGSQQSWREDISKETSESDLDIIYAFPITAHREKYIVRYKDFEYY